MPSVSADQWVPPDDEAAAGATKPAADEDPGIIRTLATGVQRGFQEEAQTMAVARGERPEPLPEEKIAGAQPWEWSDVVHPYRAAEKLAYQTGSSWPTVAGGVLGGGLGTLAGGPGWGTLAGSGVGAMVVNMTQTLGPIFAKELQESPNDPDAAFSRTMNQTAISGVASGVGWMAFSAKPFQGAVKNALFQIFGVQPTVNVGQQALTNLATGKPVTEGLGQAYGQGAAGTAPIALGHAAMAPPTETGPPRPKANLLSTTGGMTPYELMKDWIPKKNDLENEQAVKKDQLAQAMAGNDPAEVRARATDYADVNARLRDHHQKYPTIQQINPDMVEVGKRIDNLAPPPPGQPTQPGFWDNKYFGKLVGKMVDGWKRSFQPELFSDMGRWMDAIFAKAGAFRAKEAMSYMHDLEDGRRELATLTKDEKLNWQGIYERDPRSLQFWTDMNRNDPDRYQKLMKILNPLTTEYQVYNELTAVEDRNVNWKLGYLENYFPRQFKDPDQERVQQFFRQKYQGPGGRAAFLKARSYDFYRDAIEAGFEPIDDNPAVAMMNRLAAGIHMREDAWLRMEANKIGAAFPIGKFITKPDGTVVPEPGTRTRTGMLSMDEYLRRGYQIDKDAMGNDWAVHPEVKDLWTNAIRAQNLYEDKGALGNIFRQWMNIKSKYVPLKLMLSGFHPLHVAHIGLVDGVKDGYWKFMGGHPLQGISAASKAFTRIFTEMTPRKYGLTESAKAIEAWLTPQWKQTPIQRGVTKMLTEMGISPFQSPEMMMKGKQDFRNAWDQGDMAKLLNPLSQAGLFHESIRKSQALIFESWIPRMKIASALAEAQALFERRPDLLDDDKMRRVAMRTLGKSIDNRYGEMFYPNLMWNKPLKQIGQASFLSLGWNLGFLREFVGGLTEPFLRRLLTETPTQALVNDVKNKTSYALFYLTNAMLINYFMSWWMSGQQPDISKEDGLMDLFMPRISGTNPDGTPRRLSNMFYTREIPMLQKHVEQHGGNYLSGLGEMIGNKMMFEPFVELWKQQDYYGYEFAKPDDPFYKQVYDTVGHILSDQFNPISITGMKRALQAAGKWDTNQPVQSFFNGLREPEAQLSLAGFGPAPAYVSRSPSENRLLQLYSEYVAPRARPAEDREVMEKRKEARDNYKRAVRAQDPDEITKWRTRLHDLLYKPAAIAKITKTNTYESMFQRLGQTSPTIQVNFLKKLPEADFKRFYKSASKDTKRNPEIQQLYRLYYGHQ